MPLIPIFQRFLPPDQYPNVLDPFAGTGRIHELENRTWAVELEQEWADFAHEQYPRSFTLCGDSLMHMADWPSSVIVDAVCTSPTYGNRMADHHEAKDSSKRNTYRHALDRPLSANNSGGLQWGEEYREFHARAWALVWSVLRPGGRFVLNIKDHVRGGNREFVSSWHADEITSLGFVFHAAERVPLKGNGFGANGAARVPYEYVLVWDKP